MDQIEQQLLSSLSEQVNTVGQQLVAQSTEHSREFAQRMLGFMEAYQALKQQLDALPERFIPHFLFEL